MALSATEPSCRHGNEANVGKARVMPTVLPFDPPSHQPLEHAIPADVLTTLLLRRKLSNAKQHTEVTRIDFQVIHLPRLQRLPDAQYVAIRTPEAWAAVWPENAKDSNAAPIPNIDFKHYILLIANTGVKPSSGYRNVLTSVNSSPAFMAGEGPSNKPLTSVYIVEIGPGSCPRIPEIGASVSYALIPQATNEIRFVITKAARDCTGPAPTIGPN
jgi:hypothetical protein